MIGPVEYKRAENFLFSLVQRNRFESGFVQLQRFGKLKKHCKFVDMNRIFNFEHNLIVSNDRSKLPDLPDEAKHQIIFPIKIC